MPVVNYRPTGQMTSIRHAMDCVSPSNQMNINVDVCSVIVTYALIEIRNILLAHGIFLVASPPASDVKLGEQENLDSNDDELKWMKQIMHNIWYGLLFRRIFFSLWLWTLLFLYNIESRAVFLLTLDNNQTFFGAEAKKHEQRIGNSSFSSLFFVTQSNLTVLANCDYIGSSWNNKCISYDCVHHHHIIHYTGISLLVGKVHFFKVSQMLL